jgi:hypothetical protein
MRFGQALDPTTAADPARYAITGATIQSATLLADNQTVVLAVTGLAGNSFTVTGTGIQDALGSAGNVTGSGLVLGFAVQDMGTLNVPSLAYAYSSNAIQVKVDGGALWFAADSANYVYRTRTGDFDVRVQVTKAQGGNPNSNLALDVRESTEPGSRHVALTVYPGMMNWTAFFRDATDGPSGVLSGNWRVGWPIGAAYPNIWLRVKYSGNTFRTYGSTNGLNWIQVGDAYTPSVPYAATLVGVGSATTDAGVPPVDGEFSNFGEFELGNASIVIQSQPANVTVVENHAANFTVGAELLNGPAGLLSYQWQSNNVDIVGAFGASYTLPVPQLANSGDKFRVIVTAPGVAAVTSAPATLTVEPDLTAPYALSSAGLAGQNVAVRFNEMLDAATATDASHYSLGGTVAVESATLLEDQQTVILNAPALSGTAFTLQVNGVKDLAGNAAVFPLNGPVLNLVVQDLGNLPSPSLVYADSPTHIVTQVNGGALWFTADAGNYIYQNRTGDFDVRVRVDKAEGGGADANIALDVRETLDPGSRHVAITVYPLQGNWTAFARDIADGTTGVLPGNWRINWPAGSGYPNIWLRMKLSASTFTTYGSTNGVDWLQIGDAYTPSVPYSSTLVGMAAVTTAPSTPPVRAEFSNFGDFSLTGASIVINAQPQNVTVVENHPATFTIGAQLINGPASALTYQWQRNGVDIPGAFLAAYTMPQPTFANQGDQFRARISAPGVSPVFSSTVTLAVVQDVVAPGIETAAALKDTSVGIRFNERMDPATATDASRYSLGGTVSILSATLLEDGRSVVLQVQGLAGSTFNLQVTGVKDSAGNQANPSLTGQVLDYDVRDIGNMVAPSQVYAFNTNELFVRADGGAIWFSADSGNFISRPMSGDFDVRVQVSKVSGGDLNSNMILDVRETLDPGSRHVALTVYPGQPNWTAFSRNVTDGPSGVLAGLWRVGWPDGAGFPNIWLRLKKAGDTYTTYGGTNGMDWIQIGDPYLPAVPFAANLVGMASAVTDAGQPPLVVEYSNFGPTPAAIVPPPLRIIAGSGSITLIWPVAAAGFQLQQTSQLGSGSSWIAVGGTPIVSGTNHTLSLPLATGSSFYRLAR